MLMSNTGNVTTAAKTNLDITHTINFQQPNIPF